MPVKRHMHKTLGFAVIAALAAIGLEAHAAELQVTATLPDSCTVEGGTLAFGVVDPSDSAEFANAPINVQCSTAGSVDIVLDEGLYHGLGANGRSMKRDGSNDYLDYRFYLSAAYSQEWPANNPISHPVSVGPNPIMIYGRIDQQTRPGGNYADTVQITMTVD